MNAQGQRVDVLAVMQLAADMLDTGEFEVDRETGRQLEAAIPLVAELIEFVRDAECYCLTGIPGRAAHTCRRCDLLARIGGEIAACWPPIETLPGGVVSRGEGRRSMWSSGSSPPR